MCLYIFLFYYYIYTPTVGLCVSVPISNLSSHPYTYSTVGCVSLYMFLFYHYIYTPTVGLCVSVPALPGPDDHLRPRDYLQAGPPLLFYFCYINKIKLDGEADQNKWGGGGGGLRIKSTKYMFSETHCTCSKLSWLFSMEEVSLVQNLVYYVERAYRNFF